MRPGSKGIFLSPDTWSKLVGSVEEVREAIGNQEETQIEIDGKKKMTLSQFKGQWYVGVREYWTNPNNEVLPGKKGISLKIEEFNRLCEVLDEVTDWLE